MPFLLQHVLRQVFETMEGQNECFLIINFIIIVVHQALLEVLRLLNQVLEYRPKLGIFISFHFQGKGMNCSAEQVSNDSVKALRIFLRSQLCQLLNLNTIYGAKNFIGKMITILVYPVVHLSHTYHKIFFIVLMCNQLCIVINRHFCDIINNIVGAIHDQELLLFRICRVFLTFHLEAAVLATNSQLDLNLHYNWDALRIPWNICKCKFLSYVIVDSCACEAWQVEGVFGAIVDPV